MSRLRRAVRAAEARSLFNPWTSEIPAPGDALVLSAGQRVDTDSSLQLTAAYSCISLLEDDISQLPLQSFRKADAVREPVDPPAVVNDPDPEVEQWEWVARVVGSMAIAGNAYGYLYDRDRRGYPQHCKLIPAREANPQRNRATGARELVVRSAELGNETLPWSEVLHIPLTVLPGKLKGLSPIEQAARTIGISIATEEFGARFFGEGAVPASAFETDDEVTDDFAQRTIAKFVASHSGRRRPAFFGGGLKWKQISINPDESQFLETRKHNIDEVASIWRVPPHMIGSISQHASQGGGKGIEDQAIGYVVHTLGPYLTRIERALSSKKVSPSGQYVKFNVGALLRGDTVNRYTAYAIARQWGWMSVNDIRRLEDMTPLDDGGDTYLQPLNMIDAEKALQVLIDNANNQGSADGNAA